MIKRALSVLKCSPECMFVLQSLVTWLSSPEIWCLGVRASQAQQLSLAWFIVFPFQSRTWISHPISTATSTQAGCFTASPSVSYAGCVCRTALIPAWMEFGCRPASWLWFWPRFENTKISWTITAFIIFHSWLPKLEEGLLWQDFSQISTKSHPFSALVLT